ncbi:MAG: tetratricopeptide repeat protein [Verrucomicrobia bacterium]|nr:tetratricopeptide repeat protein [Verrucomicrobiota bacterium]
MTFRLSRSTTGVLLSSLLAGLLLAERAQAVAPASHGERLRRLARMPRLTFELGAEIHPVRGFAVFSTSASVAHEFSELDRALRGEPQEHERQARLGKLYRRLGRVDRAGEAFARAVDLYRNQGAEVSEDWEVLTNYGEALAGLNRHAEAERVLRRAVALAPGQCRCQTALGEALAAQAMAVLLPAGHSGGIAGVTGRGEASESGRPTPAQVEGAERLVDEALAAHDRAVGLAPAEAATHFGRGLGRVARARVYGLVGLLEGEEDVVGRMNLDLYTRTTLADFVAASRLGRGDARMLGTAALFEVGVTHAEQGRDPVGALGTPETWAGLAEGVRRSVRGVMAQLEELGLGAEPGPAAQAFEVLGLLQFLVVHDLTGAAASLRQAQQLDPGRDGVWEVLIYGLTMSRRFGTLVGVCQELVQTRDTVRHRVWLAKAHERLHQLDPMLEEAERAYALNTDDVLANLSLAAALLRTGDADAVLGRAAGLLLRAERLVGNKATRDQTLNLLYTRGLFLGMLGQVDAARANLRRLLELDPGDGDARAVLEVLE